MSPNVAGVTLLALGNGSPDIFSTIASVQQNEIGQALGSLLGGGMFVASVVVGSVTLASKSVTPKVTRRPFLRDVGFYFGSIITIFFICWDGNIHLWQSVLLIGFYALYVIVIVVGRLIYQKRKKLRLAKLSMTNQALAIEDDQDDFEFVGSGTGGKSYDDYDEPDVEPEEGEQNLATKLATELLSQNTSFGAQATIQQRRKQPRVPLKERMAKRMAALGVYLSKVGFWRNKTKNELKREVRMTLARGGEGHHLRTQTMRQTVQRISDLTDPEEFAEEDSESEIPAQGRVTAGDWGIGSIVNHQLLSINNDLPEEDVDDELIESTYHGHHGGGDDYAPLLDEAAEYQEPDYSWEDNIDDSTCYGALRLNWRNLKEILEWDEGMETWRSRIFMFADFPRLILQHFSIHFAEPETYFRPFYVLMPIGVAIFMLSAFGAWTLVTKIPGPLSAWIMPLAIVLSIVVYFTTKNDEPPIYEPVFVVLGLLMSVMWIYFTAQELVALLGACGKILRISNAIMGLTVLAWGNSIGDMVSNVVVSRKGFPQMALSACYASPLCTMLLGLGIALTMRLAKLRVAQFSILDQLTNTVFWGFIFLITVLVSTVIIIPVSGFTFKRWVGFLLIGIYALFTLISLLTEFRLLFPKTFLIWDKWPGRVPN